MMAITHVLIAIAVTEFVFRDPFLFAVAALASLLPDIDDSRSFIGRIIPVSEMIRRAVGHRTITHSIFFCIAISLPAAIFGFKIALAVFTGSLSHCVADSFGNSGAALLYPFRKKKIKLACIDTGSWAEIIVLFMTIGLILRRTKEIFL